jgi:hypothetical protein
MAKKHITILIGCMAFVSVAIVALYALSPISKRIYRNSFTRNFVHDALTQEAEIDLQYNSYYIAGTSTNKIYLGNFTAPAQMIVADKSLADSQHVKLQIRNLGKIEDPKKFKVVVDSPHFFLTHGSMPGIFRGRINEWQAERLIPDSAYFVDAIPFESSSLALRSYSTFSKAFELAKATVDSPYFEFKYDLLKKQIDGIFCVEGNLHYNRELKKIVYLYTYRNQYMVIDTNLNLIHQYHTIDTFSHAMIKVANVKSNESILTGLPARINGYSCVSGKYLFVRSNLMAKNDSEERFREGAVIDVYDLTTGNYLHSFYINNYQNIGMSMFQVFGNSLVALFDKYMVVYNLNLDVL